MANAGIASYGSVLQVDPEMAKRVLDVNLLGVFHTARATVPALIERRGYLLIVSSLAAFAAAPGMAPYDMSKAGNEQLANALRLEVAHLGVGVGSAHMSWIDTAMVRDSKADLPSYAEMLGQAALAVEQDHLVGSVRGRLRQGHRGACGPRVLPALGGPVPLAQAGLVHPTRRTARPQKRA